MKNTFVMLVVLLMSPLAIAENSALVGEDLEALYQERVDEAKNAQAFTAIQTNQSLGGGLNANTDITNYADTADRAGYASNLTSAEKNAIIAAARSGTSSRASYATTSGTANKVATSERNSIISSARSGRLALSTICVLMPTLKTTEGSSYYDHKFVWKSSRCQIEKKKTGSVPSSGGGGTGCGGFGEPKCGQRG